MNCEFVLHLKKQRSDIERDQERSRTIKDDQETFKERVASPHNVMCSDLCMGFKNVKTWRVSNPRRVSLLLELISQVYVTATPSRLSLLNLAIHRVVRECIVYCSAGKLTLMHGCS